MSAAAGNRKGVPVALVSGLLLGMTPIFGKQAIQAGLPPLAVVAARTAGAALLLLLVIVLFRRRFLYIYPVGLVGCLIAGGINGAGSLLFYAGLARIDAGLGQLLYSLYPIFVAFLLFLDGHQHSRLTVVRLLLSLPAVLLLLDPRGGQVDLPGAGLMLGAGFLYALHIPINQRVLYEAPAPTVTLYTLIAMTAVVVPAHLLLSPSIPVFPAGALIPLLGLTGVTFLSRLALFLGVKAIGGMQTALLGMVELLVAVGLAHLWLGESLNTSQWLGALLLALALLLVGRDRIRPPRRGRGWLYWLRPPVLPGLAQGTPEPAKRRVD